MNRPLPKVDIEIDADTGAVAIRLDFACVQDAIDRLSWLEGDIERAWDDLMDGQSPDYEWEYRQAVGRIDV